MLRTGQHWNRMLGECWTFLTIVIKAEARQPSVRYVAELALSRALNLMSPKVSSSNFAILLYENMPPLSPVLSTKFSAILYSKWCNSIRQGCQTQFH